MCLAVAACLFVSLMTAVVALVLPFPSPPSSLSMQTRTHPSSLPSSQSPPSISHAHTPTTNTKHNEQGLPEQDVRDAYPGVVEDLKTMIWAGDLIALKVRVILIWGGGELVYVYMYLS